MNEHDVLSPLADWRRAFDQTFSAPPPEARADRVSLLAISTGGLPCALRLAELAGLEAPRRVVPLPDGPPGLLGACGIRGRLVPVFDLGLLLGAAGGEAPRWLALHGEDEPVGLAFETLEGFLQPARAAIHPAEPHHASPHAPEFLAEGAGLRRVISLPSILAALKQQVASVPR